MRKGARQVKIMVGRLTLAAALIAAGILLITGNVTQAPVVDYATRLWPMLLIALGAEWIWAARRSPEGQWLQPDIGSLVMLAILAVLSSHYANEHVEREWRAAQVIPSAPRPPSPPRPPRPERGPSSWLSGNMSHTVMLRHDAAPPGLKAVHVTDSSGTVEVVAGEQFRVELRVTGYGLREQDAEQAAGQVRLLVEPGETTRVRAERPQGVGGRSELVYRVEVPAGVSLQVATASGPVSVTGVRGDVTAQSSSGDVQVRGAGGGVTATSSSGTLTVEQAAGPVHASASSGRIAIVRPGGPVTAQSTSGDIRVEADQFAGPYELTASSGEITVTLPPGASVTADARSTSGRVSGPSWLAIGEGRGSGRGLVGSGQYILLIRTSSGAIQIGGG